MTTARQQEIFLWQCHLRSPAGREYLTVINVAVKRFTAPTPRLAQRLKVASTLTTPCDRTVRCHRQAVTRCRVLWATTDGQQTARYSLSRF